jgi:hypothetical protein
MESYKHSCPFCGQHIEYTAGYCGKQMVCPICGKTVTFPAVPPGGKGLSLRIKRPEAARAAKWPFDFFGILAPLRRFQHWNMVLVCLVPFIIVGALLAGAAMLRKQLGNTPAAPVAPLIQADPNAWQKMTDLVRADQLVQKQLAAVRNASAAVAAAEENRAKFHAYWHVRRAADQATYQSVLAQYKAKDEAVANAHKVLDHARQCFDSALRKYQQLGGTTDYRRQLSQ